MAKWLFISLAVALPALGHGYLGAESCQGCHPDAYAAWRTSAHSRAREALSSTQLKDARCLSCHSPQEGDKQVENVTCETCHGGGQYYSSRYVMKDSELSRLVGLLDPSEKGCRTCHDSSSPSLKTFDFAAKLKAIDHWTKERERRVTAAPSRQDEEELSQTFEKAHRALTEQKEIAPTKEAQRVAPTLENHKSPLLGVKVRMAKGSTDSSNASAEKSRR